MKTKLQILGIALIGLSITSCSSSMYMSKSSVTPTDDIYYTPSKTNPTETTSSIDDSHKNSSPVTEKKDPTELDFASLESKYSKILSSDTSKIDTLIYKAESDNPYERILSNSYQDSYERRLNARLSPRYGLSNIDVYYSDAYFYASAYDPAFYNIVVMGDQVWVEPWYISNLFGHTNNFSYGFGLSLLDPFGYSWYNGYTFSYYGKWNPFFGYYNPMYNNYYNHHINTNYFGRRPDNSTNLTSLNRRTGISYENEIISSRRRGGMPNESGFSRVDNNIRTRNTNQTEMSNRSGQRNNQEIIRRGNRNESVNTTRLRGETTNRNINTTEPTRRNNNNSYQRPRSTNSDSYIRTSTRNQNGSVSRDNTTRNTSTVRENRNTSPTYNRPNRVDTSTERGRTTNSGNTNRESNYRESGRTSGSSSSTRTNSGTNSSSTTNSNTQQNSSSGSHDSRRR